MENGIANKISPERNYESEDLSNINWSDNGKIIAYNRKVLEESEGYFQIFVLKQN